MDGSVGVARRRVTGAKLARIAPWPPMVCSISPGAHSTNPPAREHWWVCVARPSLLRGQGHAPVAAGVPVAQVGVSAVFVMLV